MLYFGDSPWLWLKAGKSRVQFPLVSLEFFTDLILPAAPWHWSRLSL